MGDMRTIASGNGATPQPLPQRPTAGSSSSPSTPVPSHGPNPKTGAAPKPTTDAKPDALWKTGHVDHPFAKSRSIWMASIGGVVGAGIGALNGGALASESHLAKGDAGLRILGGALIGALVADAALAAVGGVATLFGANMVRESHWVANPSFDETSFDEHLKSSFVGRYVDDGEHAVPVKQVDGIYASKQAAHDALQSPESVARMLSGAGTTKWVVVQASGKGSTPEHLKTDPAITDHEPTRWAVMEVDPTAHDRYDEDSPISSDVLYRTDDTSTRDDVRGDQVWKVTEHQIEVFRSDDHDLDKLVAKGKPTLVEQHFDRYTSADSLVSG